MKKIKAPRFDRLKKLADFLISGKLGTDVFDFGEWYLKQENTKTNICKTSGCALGQCVTVFPRHFKITKTKYGFEPRLKKPKNKFSELENDGCEFFVLSIEEFYALFTPTSSSRIFGKEMGNLPHRASAKRVGENILRFIELKTKQINMANDLLKIPTNHLNDLLDLIEERI